MPRQVNHVLQNQSAMQAEMGGHRLSAIFLFLLNITAAAILLFIGDEDLLSSLVLFVAFLIFSLAYSLLFASDRPQPSAFSASVYLGYGLILPAIYQVRTNNFYWASGSVDQGSILPASFLTLLAVVAFYAGVAYRRKQRAHIPRRDAYPATTATLPPQFQSRGALPLLAVAILISALCLLSYATFGSEMFFATRAALWTSAMNANLDLSTFGLFLALPRGLAIGGLALAGFLFTNGMRGWAINTSLILMIAANLAVNFPTSLARFALIALLFTIMLTLFRRAYFRYFRLMFFLFPLALYGVFPILGVYNRGYEINLEIHHPGLEYLADGDLDGFQSTANAIEYVNDHGHLYGQVVLSAALFFVPRAIWPGKLEPSGVFVSESAGYSFLNISMPLQAELYLDGWYVFSFLGMLLLGRAASAVDARYITGLKSPVLGVMAVLLAGYFPVILRGALLGIIAGVAATMAVPLLWWLLLQMTGHQRRPQLIRPVQRRA